MTMEIVVAAIINTCFFFQVFFITNILILLERELKV